MPPSCMQRDGIAHSIRAVLNQLVDPHSAEIKASKNGNLHELERLGKEIENARAVETMLTEKFRAHS